MGNALIVKRLSIIVAASRRLGRGDFTARTNINYKEDELGWLAQSFDQMAVSLEEKELERKQSEWSLKERVNELNCLYGISSLIELPDITIDEILQRTVMLIPPAWQFPEITEACIVLEKQTFQTANFRETPWILGNIIIVNGKPAGEIVVSYLEERPQSDEGPFLKEERQLIKAIAERLGRVIEYNIAEMQIRLNERRLMSLFNIMQLSTKTTQEFLDYALNEVIKITQSKIGYIYFYRENSKQFILNTWSKDVMKECTIANPQTCYDLEKTGVWGETVRQRKPIIINDFQAAHPLKKGYPEGHAHLNKFLTVPVFKDEAIVAVVGVANKAGNYDETDVLQLRLFMDAVWKSVDIKMAEENLREGEERIRAIVNAAHDAIIIIDNNGNVSYWNPAAEHILGYTSAEAIGRNLHELIAPERFLQSYHAAFPEFQQDGRGNAIGKTLELAARRKDGQEIDVALSLSAVNIKGVWNAVGIIQDISERKQEESQREAALEALRKSEERFKQLAEVFPETIFEADMKGNVTYANEHGLKQFGFTEEDIAKGVNIFDMISHDDLNLAVERIQSRIQGGNKKYLEYQALKKDGSAFHALALSVPIILDGAPVGIRGFILDITERKRGEIYREMGSEILQILNKPGDFHDLIQSILAILKTRTGFDAVGIRLQDGNDFPYIAESGFSNDFLLTENSLMQRGEDGGLCHDEDGNIKLECTCGLVISGKTDPSNSLFTKGGSFWINDTSFLLDLSADHDPRLNPRNKCIYQGYASLALVPIRTKDQIVGLMQFNNRRKNSFFLADIEQFESIAANIAEALLRKDAEKALAESEERYRFLTDHTADHIWTMDLSLRFIYSSPAVIKILGYTASELLELAIDQFFTTESFAIAEKLLTEELETDKDPSADPNRIRTLQTEHYHKNGHLVWLESSITFIRDAAMRPTGILGVSRDITERKKAEEELKKSEEQVRLLLNSTAEAIYGIDLQGNCTFANPSCLRILGYADMKQLLGKNMHSLIHHSYPGGTPMLVEDCRMYRALLEDKGEHAEDEVFWRADGTGFPVEYWSYPEIVNGKIYGAVVAFIDITERKHAEEQIKHLATHDLLTDLPSLRLAKDRMSVAINMARRYKKAAAVMFIDLDGFKAVNDTLGHDAGDYVLIQVAKRLLSCVRETDTVARVGGDEFLIIASEINTPDNAALIAEKVIQLVSKPVFFKGRQAVVGTSIGIALFPDHGEDMDQLIKLADEAMYKVKNAGKNGFCFVNTSIK